MGIYMYIYGSREGSPDPTVTINNKNPHQFFNLSRPLYNLYLFKVIILRGGMDHKYMFH